MPKKPKEIHVVIVEPMKPPREATIHSTLEAMQEVVGGYIQIVQLGKNVELVCHEEGKLLQLQANRLVPELNDVICGTFFLCRRGGGTLNDTMTKSMLERFKPA